MKRIYLIATAALALVSCDKNEENIVPSTDVAHICATIGESIPTRASDNSWTNGDQIGVTATLNDLKLKINMKYTTDGGENFTGNPIYFYNPMVLTAYYPFKGSEGNAPGIIEVDTRADIQSADNQPGIDFLWDSQSKIYVVDNKPEIRFNFSHKMSKLTLCFVNGNDGTNVGKIISYRIDGLVMDGTFNPETGECKCVANGVPESMTITLGEGAVESDKNLAPLILLPQKPGTGNVKLHIYANEVDNPDVLQHYTCNLSFDDGELKPGYNYQYKVTVSKAAMTVEKTEIANWTDFTPEEKPNAGSAD